MRQRNDVVLDCERCKFVAFFSLYLICLRRLSPSAPIGHIATLRGTCSLRITRKQVFISSSERNHRTRAKKKKFDEVQKANIDSSSCAPVFNIIDIKCSFHMQMTNRVPLAEATRLLTTRGSWRNSRRQREKMSTEKMCLKYAEDKSIIVVLMTV